ncbi:helix-turn-helix domain-containing protein [Staphylococcus pettenkoferi]|uniref:helix-turn-helix domain-containing protein n=1 Tax=Staphylococcus pettenkoferi TaxID=170573 RepID=UPI0011A5D4CC|nr:helix-turn-helix transcriptional regulator [Staphylococcus pettenkoferi]
MSNYKEQRDTFNEDIGSVTFGKKLKSLRGDKSIRKAAEGIGISHTYLDSLEKGCDPRTGKERKPTWEVLYKIAKYYKCDVDDLIRLTNPVMTDVYDKQMKEQRDTLIHDIADLQKYKRMYKELTEHIKFKAETNPSEWRYISLVHFIDDLEDDVND